jgi:hypothetical protein
VPRGKRWGSDQNTAKQRESLDNIMLRLDPTWGKLPIGKRAVQEGWWYARSGDIYLCAAEMGVPPELLVDEGWYYERCGLAPYRLIFAAHRKGLPLSRVLQTARNMYGSGISFKAFKNFLGGNIWWRAPAQMYVYARTDFRSWGRHFNGLSLGFVFTLCKVVDFPPASLFRTLRMEGRFPADGVAKSVYMAVHKVIGRLSEADMAVMVGVGALLASGDERLVREGFGHLVDWWCSHRAAGECREAVDQSGDQACC